MGKMGVSLETPETGRVCDEGEEQGPDQDEYQSGLLSEGDPS